MTDTTAGNNRLTTAVRLARIEEKLDALTGQVSASLEAAKKEADEADKERRKHSRRLDIFELALARLELGQRERDKLREDVDALRIEQRIWTGATTALAALAAALAAWLKRD